MAYVIIIPNSHHIDGEERIDVKGTVLLERYTDSRIVAIYGKKAKAIYKLYTDSSCVQIV